MSTAGDVNVKFGADVSEVVAAVDKLNGELGSVAKTADVTAGKISGGFGKAGDGATKAVKALGPLAGTLGKISPEAGSAASSIVRCPALAPVTRQPAPENTTCAPDSMSMSTAWCCGTTRPSPTAAVRSAEHFVSRCS